MDESLWQNWLQNRQEQDLWSLVEYYREFSGDVARYMHVQLQFTGAELDDFIQTAIFGLIDAIKGYDDKLGSSFTHYARFRIRGALLNSLPKSNERQSINAYYKRLEYERNKSLQAGNRLAAVVDLANLVIQLSYSYLLDEMSQQIDGEEVDNPYQQYHLNEVQAKLRKAVGRLSEQERQVIEYHYFSYESFESIADIMSLTKGRISQIHKKAIHNLQTLIRENYQSYM